MQRVALICFLKQVPSGLVVNADQTAVLLCSAGKKTYAPRGAKQVRLVGSDDKRQITALLSVSMDGDVLPPQLVFAGTTIG